MLVSFMYIGSACVGECVIFDVRLISLVSFRLLIWAPFFLDYGLVHLKILHGHVELIIHSDSKLNLVLWTLQWRGSQIMHLHQFIFGLLISLEEMIIWDHHIQWRCDALQRIAWLLFFFRKWGLVVLFTLFKLLIILCSNVGIIIVNIFIYLFYLIGARWADEILNNAGVIVSNITCFWAAFIC